MSFQPLYFDDIALRPHGAQIEWMTTDDNIRLRALFAPAADAWGTVHLYSGRTEYLEKYHEVISACQKAGLNVVSCDWRGQGLSQRVHDDPNIGHVPAFDDYQHDAKALWAFAQSKSAQGPHFLIGHSMGGAIGLRAIYEGLLFEAAAFSGPMWGIYFSPLLQTFGPYIMAFSRRFVNMNRYAYGTSETSYLHQTQFEENELTYDQTQFNALVHHVTTHPELSLGGPSLKWIDEAIKECDHLVAAPAPEHVPSLVFLGEDEKIVSKTAIHERVSTWPSAQLVRLEHTKHECLMEDPARRDKTLAQMIDHFKSHRDAEP